MSLTVTPDDNLKLLLRAAGLLDAEGHVNSNWFQDPLAGVRQVLADPEQRAALLDLLEQVLDTAGVAPSPGDGEWVPLLDPGGLGNIFLTVTDQVIGVAAQLATPDGSPVRGSGSVHVPILDVSGDLRAIAGTAEGPLELSLDLELEDGAPASAVRLRATVDLEGDAGFFLTLEGVDVGAGPETLSVGSDTLGRDLVHVVQTLVGDLLEDVPAGDLVADHLFGALGLDGILPPLPVDRLVAEPEALRTWFAQLAGTPAHLEAWFGHISGLLGADAPSALEPLSARLVDLGGGAGLVLRAAVVDGALVLTLAVSVPGGPAQLEATADLVAIPLAAAAPVRLVPSAAVRVRAPASGGPLVDAAPTIEVASLAAGLRFDGTTVVPELRALGVVLEGTAYASLDLTDVNAIAGAATDGLRAAIQTAIGDNAPALALLVLAGLLPPDSDTDWPDDRLVDAADLGRGPTAAIAAVHRDALADLAHPWSHLFAELGTLLGLAGGVAGAGTAVTPWRIEIAADGALRLDLVAWNARDAATPADEQRLRLGLQASATVGDWSTILRSELLAFDLPAAGAGAVRVVGEQRLQTSLSPVPDALGASGISVEVGAISASATWQPDRPLAIEARVVDVRASVDGDGAGPVTLVFPPADPSAPDLGLGAALPELEKLLRLLVSHAARSWGGDGVHALGELLGLYGDGPLLRPPDPADLGSLFARPGDALREHLRALALDLGADGDPNAARALSSLAALLRDQVPRAADGLLPRLDAGVGGTGTHADPWTVPLADGDERAELLVWLDPDGPPAEWAAALAERTALAADGRTLVALAPQLGAFLDVAPWLDADVHGAGLDALAQWIAAGDGASALESQLPDLPGWTAGAPLSTPHDAQPSDPAAVVQIATQLDAWAAEDGGRAVLLVGPRWSDHAIWSDLLAAVEPGRPAEAHFDLRDGVDPAGVTAVAAHYTADLDDDGAGDLAALAAQLGTLVDRVAALTGHARVIVVAHSTPGVAARVLASGRPEAVRGIVTLGTPHAGGAPAPLTDPGLADAVRAARALAGGTLAGSGAGAVLDRLDAALNGVAGAFSGPAFAAAPAGTGSGGVPGLALGSAVGGNLVASLVRRLAGRVTDAAAARGADRAPTHLGLGARLGLTLDAAAADDPEIHATVRLDAARVRLAPGAGEPERPAQAATLQVEAARPGGWLVGEAAGPGPRVRSAELAVALEPAAAGGVRVTPRLLLRDAGLDPARRDLELGDSGFAAALELVAEALGAPGSVVDEDVLARLQSAPGALLREKRDALVAAVENRLGGALGVDLASLPLQLTLDPATWELRLRTTADLVLGEGVGAGFEARLALATLTPSLDAALQAGAARLVARSSPAQLVLSAPPWLQPLVVVPAPAPAVLRETLAPLLPRLALSAAMSAALEQLLDVRGSISALDALLADPGARLAELAGGDIQDLLQAAARAFGVDDADGLALPAGLLLRASGADPLHLELTGTIDLDAAGDTLGFDVTLDVAQSRAVDVGATIALSVGLPGTWGHIGVTFGADAAGVRLSVEPENAGTIQLLPNFSGFDDLAGAAATSLLPHLLQAIVDELRPAAGAPDGVLGAVLAVATSLGVYADDAAGFEDPARVATLAAMLQPGWLEQEIADPAALAQLVAGVFGPPPLLQLPVGNRPVAVGDQLAWSAQLPGGGTVGAQVRLGLPVAVSVSLTGFDAGPLVIDSARAGFDGDLAFDVTVKLDPGGDLAFLTPSVEFGVDGTRIAAALLPLGAGQRAALELELAPAPAVTFTEAGALALLTEWGVPLVANLLLQVADAASVLDERFWNGGPSARDIAVGAGLIAAGPGTPTLDLPLPPLDEMALGAVGALAHDVSIDFGSLTVGLVDEGGRKGLRLKGSQLVATDDLEVDMRFGVSPDWLDATGVTLWLLKPAVGMPPFALDLGLDVMGIGVQLRRQDPEVLLDSPLTIGSAGAFLFFSLDLLDAAGRPQLAVSELGGAIELRDTRIAIEAGDGDSIVQKLLPAELAAPFWLALEGHLGRGFELHGGIGPTPGAIELTFPLDLDFGGVVQLDEVFVSAAREGTGVELVAAISGGAELGPVAVAIQRVGVRVRVGPAGTQLDFKPPDGLGLSIDAPSVRLGGFLLVDEAHGRYVGAVEIAIAEKFSIVAIGIITTKKPDGTPGFSLLFLIAIEFPVPIPLGYGFFFAGAGGLLGLNRGIDLDRLRLGLRSGTADSILFPTDVVARIDTIVRDLEEVFPIAEGRFLIAPMAKITWSTPPLVTAKIGLVIEIGSPLRLALLGVLSLALPNPDEAVVKLNVAFLGAIDIPGSMLSFDASIYDSYVGYDDFKLSLEGDMALRILWGPQPDFVTTIGGFHPSYHPEAHLRLPPMRRMSVSLLKDNPRLTLSCYFAVTTNTVQFGARLELMVRAGDFSVEGELGFDVLVQIVPLHLDARIYGRVSVKAGGSELLSISLDLTLEGPTPWIARGTGRFKILFFSVEVAFEERFGVAAPVVLPEIAVLVEVLRALADDAAWTAELGDGANALVHLIAPPEGTLVIDAAGLLTVRQRVLPLGTDFDRFGTARPSDVSRVSVSELRVGQRAVDRQVGAAATRPVTDAFAPAAFRSLADAEKLRAPAFEQRQAGVQAINGDRLTTDAVLGHPVTYEQIVFDSAASPDAVRGTHAPTQETFEALVPGGAAGRSPLSTAKARRAERGSVLDVAPARERYAVTRIDDLRPLNAQGSAAAAAAAGVLVSFTDAQARRDALIGAGVATDLQIVPEGQLAA